MKVNRENEGDYRGPLLYVSRMEIGAKIKEFRTALKMSQGELAKGAGVSQTVISDLERGEQKTTKFLPQIAATLRRHLADFDAIYSSRPPSAPVEKETDPPAGDSLVFIAVHEAFTLAGFSDADSTKIASMIQLVITAHPPVPRGMSREDVVRRIVRWDLGDVLRPTPTKSHK